MISPLLPEVHQFLILARTRNISRAAETLGVTQSSLSKALQRMEGHWGTPLFSRSKKGIELTLEGERAQRLLSGLQQEWESHWRLKEQDAMLGTIRLGAHLSLVQTSFHRFFPTLLKKFPGVNFELQHDRSSIVTRKVIQAEVDMGLVINPQRHPELVIKPLRRESVGVWRGRATRRKPRVIYFNPEMINVYHFLKSFSDFKQVPLNDYLAIGSLLRSGEEWGILPSSVQEIFAEIELEKELMPAQLCLIYRKDRSRHPAMQKIAEEIRTSFLK